MDTLIDEEPPPFRLACNEIGNTPFIRARHLEKRLGFRNIFLKFEGSNPSGTHKDRISLYHVKKALKEGYTGITVGTCGNLGLSIAYLAGLAGLQTSILIPERYHLSKKRMRMLKSLKAEVILTSEGYEEAVEESKRLAKKEGLYDANPGGRSRGWEAYKMIAYEIFEQLGHAPTVVSTPVGNGTTLYGVYLGFKELNDKGLIDELPHFVGSSTVNGNPVVKSFKMGLSKTINLDPNEIKETSINEPLISYHSYDGDLALKAIYNTDGWADYSTDACMLFYQEILKAEEKINVLPASASAVDALIKFKNHRILNSDYVIILTGRENTQKIKHLTF